MEQLGKYIVYGFCILYSIVGASAAGMYFSARYQTIKVNTKSRYYLYKSLIIIFSLLLLLVIGKMLIFIFFERYPQGD